MALNLSILVITFLVNLSLSIFVLLKNHRSLRNQSFSLFVLAISGWTLSLAITLFTQNIFWGKITFFFGTMTPGMMLFFVLFFSPKARWQNKYWLLIVPPIFFAAISLLKSELLFQELKIVRGGLNPEKKGALYPMFSVYVVGYCLAAARLAYIEFKKSTGLYKIQIKYVVLGTSSCVFLALASNIVLPFLGVDEFKAWGPIFSIIMISFISYAIIKYRFLEIKIVIEAVITYLTSLLLTAIVLLFIEDVLYWQSNVSLSQLNFIILACSILIFPFTKKIIAKVFEIIDRPETINAEHSIKNLAESLTHLITLEEITDVVNKTIMEIIGVKVASTIVYEENKADIYSSTHYPECLNNLAENTEILDYLNESKTPLLKQEIQLLFETGQSTRQIQNIRNLIMDCDIEIYLPLIHQNKLIGVIAMTGKISKETFSHTDITLLETIAYQASTAVSNGIFYKKIHDLNVNLKKKVNEQTKHLNDLLRVKDEFVKITSHQLRTPTTIIKGMLSMILDGSLDDNENKRKQYLEQAFQSVQNLERIIHGILGASDMTAGKLLMTFEPVDIREMILRLVAERNHLANKKNINLKFNDTVSELPKIPADKVKLREALANLIDNAIHYTPQGEVCISLEASPDNNYVSFCVKDSGIGIKNSEKHKIFKKFSRTEQSTMLNPNGTGLGLYIVKQIIDAHHGAILVESAGENMGTLFKVTIPAAKAQI